MSKVTDKRTSEEEVRIIADKFPQMHGNYCAFHLHLCELNLQGHPINLISRIPMPRGRPVKVNEKSGIVFERSPEEDAFHRWINKDFNDLERIYAKQWREELSDLDLDTISSNLYKQGIVNYGCKSLNEAKNYADNVILENKNYFELIKVLFQMLNVDRETEYYILKRWSDFNYKTLATYAPYAGFVLKVLIFFLNSRASGLINNKNSSFIDVAYMCYLPFCNIFVSSDKLHKRCAPLFLRNDQGFVDGDELKADLSKINSYYSKLPDTIKEKGISEFATYPPIDEQFFVTELRDKYFPSWRSAFKPSKDMIDSNVVSEICQADKASTLTQEEIDFDLTNPETTTLKRKIYKIKGSWYQLPKDIDRHKR